MGKMQRTKGASYEREVCDAFGAALGVKVQRMIGQARDGGADILDVKPLVIEAKRRKTLGTVMGWLSQCMAAAFGRCSCAVDGGICDTCSYILTAGGAPVRKVPIVVAREDQGESIVIMRLIDFLPMFVDLQKLRSLAETPGGDWVRVD